MSRLARWAVLLLAAGVAGGVCVLCYDLHDQAAINRGDPFILGVGVAMCVGIVVIFCAFTVSLFHRPDHTPQPKRRLRP